RLFFVDNVDPDWVAPLLAMVDFKKTLFIVVSKSGGTTEPMALYSVVRKKLGNDFRKHLVFVTDPKEGLLRKLGEREKITMFDIPTKVGGRFSVLTAASMLPARLAGIDIAKIMFGARKMREMIQETKLEKNPALLLACLQFLLDTKKAKPMTVIMPYSNLLFRTADWYRQLLAESIGKNPKTGPTPINALGTTDQHSQLQLYNEGPANKWFVFLKVAKHASELKLGSNLPDEIGFLNGLGMEAILNASLEGTAEALAKNGKPNITLALEKIDEMEVGALMMLMEFQVALLGLLYKVDAFDQPGVEQSKKITKQILSGKRIS
ncbi:glucose-6-phosphate isomerase, partial [Candidatus Peregrinibacteria bacterium]|nr:glucose-6-phosphate isomerase [Candidatus Peregrinibacteria bacterium]